MTAIDSTGSLVVNPPRLLAGWHDPGRADLASHLSVHGSNPAPSGQGPGFSAALLEEVRRSGLTGRGGAGFPSARKWDLARSSRRPLLIVNAMEGEPASDKDRVLLASAPHLVLDGAELAAVVIGAHEVLICVADDRPASAHLLRASIEERWNAGLAQVDFRVIEAPRRYVTGEESALVSWVGGANAQPTFRPDKGIPLSVGRKPALVHNAETLANVALIARHGAEWFRAVGLDDTPGTTLVTVTGAVSHPGVYEVALGTPIASIFEGAGLQAPEADALVGGYGGSWLHRDLLDTPYAPRPLAEIGSAFGVGVLVALPEFSCGVAETARVAVYMAGESAGQCGPCVFGLPAIASDLARLTRGDGGRSARDQLRQRLAVVEGRGACRHPDGVVRLVRSALRVFAKDFAEHARRRPCQGWNRRPVLPVTRSADENVRRGAPATEHASTRIGAWRG